ncbi:glycosyl hydrolase catalytic core-domain-containing protein [Xylaria castorea]|nr:glycosyl hydrolase catalytic core-domain-containing protein [Xylaria castorea]
MHTTAILATAAVAASTALASPVSESRVETRSCNAGFKNTVFNTPAYSEPDLNGRFRTLQSYGISYWVGFMPQDASGGDANLLANQLHLVVTPDQVQAGLDLVTGPNPPKYLQLLNEPDGGFYGQQILTPQQAVSDLQPLLTASTSTQFLPPAPAYPQSSWLPDFFAACNCIDRFPIILAHIYNPDPNGAISAIQTVMNQFPGKTIWITELAPASDGNQGCNLDSAGVINWMNTVVGWASQQSVIERVFWNTGEYGALYSDDPAKCNPSLTNTDGTATDLLKAFGSFCG